MDERHHQPVIAMPGAFDQNSGSRLERVLFNHRPLILILCAIATLFLGFQATKVRLSADYLQTIPAHQPYVANYLRHFNDLSIQSNVVQIAVAANQGTILNAHYLQMLQEISDRVYLLPGINRPFMQSLWTANTQWVHTVPPNIANGLVMDQDYDGSPQALRNVAMHIHYAGIIGQLVEPNFKSSLIYAPLLLTDNRQPVNYGALAEQINQIARIYDAKGVTLHMYGYAMVVGDMIDGIHVVLIFFLIAIVISACALFWYTRCVRSAALVVAASLTAVIWQMGLLVCLGLNLTPYSMLVPFLVFAIGMSHGAQKMNGVMQDIGRGNSNLVAARYTFRRLFLAGLVALICDATSFAVLMVIRIGAIQQLAEMATIGVALLVFTNLILIPIILSYIGVSPRSAARSARAGNPEHRRHTISAMSARFTQRKIAAVTIFAAVLLTVFGYHAGRRVQIGDLQPGAPELRQNSRYNQDDAYFGQHYAAGRDLLVMFVDTPKDHCLDYPMLSAMDRLQWQLRQMKQVITVESIARLVAYLPVHDWEGSPKWYGLEPDNQLIYAAELGLPRKLISFGCYFDPIYVSLIDHKAATLTTVVNAAQNLIADPAYQGPGFKISLLGGEAGIAAATNIVVAQANAVMLALVYAVVIFFCLLTFRSWRATLCAVIPLGITSVLAQALMVWLHIGIKVDTLPVLALGVGIGVDYAIYVLSILLRFMRAGLALPEAWVATMMSTGKVVLLTGFTLAVGVGTWIFAPIKFQADMGLLLSFMFLWNMLGAMILLPALACFLLPARLFGASGNS